MNEEFDVFLSLNFPILGFPSEVSPTLSNFSYSNAFFKPVPQFYCDLLKTLHGS